ncbi:hypothetical protein G4Y79_12630 [Phototrophicus methaneseepsis]|uniref:Uncharacterized protein n=1 Tax=Phototrophicus methaneseepsis TaxID=2710758 RepID=A0A7S8E568_9CHLR|nr:hypothetical protein [Phototrophicus methaneseepsis]QPC80559.1 hypothetical protein G4Y79_12630 [Phototrophicus methaneseepsis]
MQETLRKAQQRQSDQKHIRNNNFTALRLTWRERLANMFVQARSEETVGRRHMRLQQQNS